MAMTGRPSARLTPKAIAQIAALVARFKIRQAEVARRAGTDRSMVSRVWAGTNVSAPVLVATYEALLAYGWRSKVPPGWYLRARQVVDASHSKRAGGRPPAETERRA